jgi:putative peptidoglycan lipid II flippase
MASLSVAAATSTVGLALLCQEVILASKFSAGATVDAYQWAVALPMAAINIFAGGTVQSLLIPNLVRLELADGLAGAARLLAWAHQALSIVLGVAIMLLITLFFAGTPYVATGFSDTTLSQSRYLFWGALPLFYFGGLASLYVAALNGARALTLAAILPAVTPLFAVLALITMGSSIGIDAVVWGASAGAALQFLLARAITRHRGYAIGNAIAPVDGTAYLSRGYWLLVVAAMLFSGIMLTSMALASGLEPGSVAVFGFAFRPVALGLAFLTVVASNVSLPHFSGLVARQNWNDLRRSYFWWVLVLLAVSVPVATAGYFFAEQLISLIYERGAFGASEVVKVASVFRLLVLQLPFYLTAMIGLRVANAIGKNKILLFVAILCFTLNLLLGHFFTRWYEIEGVAGAMVITFVAWACLVTIYVLRLCREKSASL